jgi:hypothetical protein
MKPRSRLLRYALVTTSAVAAFWIMYAGQGSSYWYRVGYMLLATSALYVGIVAVGSLRVALPLVLLSAVAYVAIGATLPSPLVDMKVRLLLAAEFLAQGGGLRLRSCRRLELAAANGRRSVPDQSRSNTRGQCCIHERERAGAAHRQRRERLGRRRLDRVGVATLRQSSKA